MNLHINNNLDRLLNRRSWYVDAIYYQLKASRISDLRFEPSSTTEFEAHQILQLYMAQLQPTYLLLHTKSACDRVRRVGTSRPVSID